MAGTTRLELPKRTPNYRFSFLPLADVMFQLLVFFMLSTNLTAYSILSIKTGTVAGDAPAQTATDDAAAPDNSLAQPRVTAIWTLNTDGVTARGQRFGPDKLQALADVTAAQGTQHVLIVVRPKVRVQEVVNVLELLSARGIASVQIADGRV